MDYFREFYGIISSRPRPLAVIAYKLYPKAQKFHGIIWISRGNFMEFPPPVFMTYKLYPKARKFYGKVWIVFRNFMESPQQPLAITHHSL